jgi:hypothetical protein
MIERSLRIRRSSYTVKPEWNICKFCKKPFETQTFDDTCNKCQHFVKYKIEFVHRVMLIYIAFIVTNSILCILITYNLIKYINDINIMLFLISLPLLFISSIMWKIFKSLIG